MFFSPKENVRGATLDWGSTFNSSDWLKVRTPCQIFFLTCGYGPKNLQNKVFLSLSQNPDFYNGGMTTE